MHDIAIIQGILDAVLKHAKDKNLEEIELDVEIGALKFVDPENAKFWLEEMLKKELGPKLKTKILIKTISPAIKCSCGFEGIVEKLHATHDMMHAGLFEMHCPKCNSKEYEIIGGEQVLIKRLDLR